MPTYLSWGEGTFGVRLRMKGGGSRSRKIDRSKRKALVLLGLSNK